MIYNGGGRIRWEQISVKREFQEDFLECSAADFRTEREEQLVLIVADINFRRFEKDCLVSSQVTALVPDEARCVLSYFNQADTTFHLVMRLHLMKPK